MNSTSGPTTASTSGLLWHRRDDRVIVAVEDEKTGTSFELEVLEGERVLDVFHHPYAYAAHRGLDLAA